LQGPGSGRQGIQKISFKAPHFLSQNQGRYTLGISQGDSVHGLKAQLPDPIPVNIQIPIIIHKNHIVLPFLKPPNRVYRLGRTIAGDQGFQGKAYEQNRVLGKRAGGTCLGREY
jgi:hypothetical protein